MSSNKKGTLILTGGIGDFLQFLPFLLEEGHQYRLRLCTHQRGIEGLFHAFSLKIDEYFYFEDLEQLNKVIYESSSTDDARPCPRTKYFSKNPFPLKENVFENGKKTIGVHLTGSRFSENTLKRYGLPSKDIPIAIASMILREDFNYLIFGKPDETSELIIPDNINVKKINFPDPFESLSYVSQCSMLLGSDSGFKTCSAMLRIPTLVWMGDYEDKMRDQVFINPYAEDGIIQTFRYRDLNSKEEIESGLALTDRFFEKYKYE